jgi:ATP-dependent DNA ligase
MLPQVLPMLAVAAEPFDSPEYCFEIKYDGVRALAAVDEMGWRLWGRERADYTARYPELDVSRRLPAGTLVDGELVVFDADGRPDLWQLLRRHGLTDPWRIRQARQWCPVRYVLFDLRYHRGRCLMEEPLVRRREMLADVCEKLDVPEVEFSHAVIVAENAPAGAVDQAAVPLEQLRKGFRSRAAGVLGEQLGIGGGGGRRTEAPPEVRHQRAEPVRLHGSCASGVKLRSHGYNAR